MANYLDANPDVAEQIDAWCRPPAGWMPGQFVPHASKGEFLGGIGYRSLDAFKPGPDITVEDYVVGMELLGCEFHLIRQADGRVGLSVSVIAGTIPSSWETRACQLAEAFGPADRPHDIAAYLRERGDAILGAPPAEQSAEAGR